MAFKVVFCVFTKTARPPFLRFKNSYSDSIIDLIDEDCVGHSIVIITIITPRKHSEHPPNIQYNDSYTPGPAPVFGIPDEIFKEEKTK